MYQEKEKAKVCAWSGAAAPRWEGRAQRWGWGNPELRFEVPVRRPIVGTKSAAGCKNQEFRSWKYAFGIGIRPQICANCPFSPYLEQSNFYFIE